MLVNTASIGRYRMPARLLVALLAVGLLLLSLRWLWPTGIPVGSIQHLSQSYGDLPFQFEPNVGQTDPSVAFVGHASGGVFYFTPSGIVMSLNSGGKPSTREQPTFSRLAPSKTSPAPSSVVQMRFVGANATAKINSGALLPGKVNYLIGSDPHAWRTNLPTYESIAYQELYEGIDLS